MKCSEKKRLKLLLPAVVDASQTSTSCRDHHRRALTFGVDIIVISAAIIVIVIIIIIIIIIIIKYHHHRHHYHLYDYIRAWYRLLFCARFVTIYILIHNHQHRHHSPHRYIIIIMAE